MAARGAHLEAERDRRWRRSGRRVGSLRGAAGFVGDVGFALLFPKAGVALPSLWEAASGRPMHEAWEDFGTDVQRVWGWKDELPRRGLAWYGRYLRGRPSFLSPGLLAELYPREGRPDDFADAALPPDALRVARVLLRSGPLPSAVLREAAGMAGPAGSSRFTTAMGQLGRALVVTHLGTEQEDAGWPSVVLELTARAFPIPRTRERDGARRRAAAAFLDTMLVASPWELGSAFGWGAVAAREALEELVASGAARRAGRNDYGVGFFAS